MKILPIKRLVFFTWLITGVGSLSMLLLSVNAMYGFVGVPAWCGNSVVDPYLRGVNWFLPAFTVASLWLGIQVLLTNRPALKLLAIIVCSLAMIGTYLTYEYWLFKVVLEGTGSLRESVWWL